MIDKRFYLSKIAVYGDNVETAVLDFYPGFNVISGPSDTGKSYVFHLLNFMMGAENPPEKISESAAYSNAFLEIASYAGEYFTIERQLKKMAPLYYAKCKICEMGETTNWQELAPKHNPADENNISRFLLNLSGIGEAKLKTNANNKTRTVSFRDVIKFLMVDEERIITKDSPILSGEATRKTAERDLFQFLITGKDSSHLTKGEDPKIRAANIRGRIELLQDMVREIASQLAAKKADVAGLKIDERIELIDGHIAELTNKVGQTSEQLNCVTKTRQEAWEKEQEAASKLITTKELISRFSLLAQHYKSDIERLSFIVEGEYLFSQLNTVNCPMCGAKYNNHELNCSFGDDNREKVIEASNLERQKIHRHLIDIDSTIETLESEVYKLELCIQEERTVIANCDRKIKSELNPIVVSVKNELQSYILERQHLGTIKQEKERQENLSKQVLLLEKKLGKKNSAESESCRVEVDEITQLCKIISDILVEWKYASIVTVTYDLGKGDFEITGKSRASHGKGYRAIAYSAFVIGLMRYMLEKELPHPGFVVLDSPITTYRESDPDTEIISDNIQAAFFEHLSNTSKSEQIIIIENKEPVDTSGLNYIHFSKIHGKGRYST